MPSQTDRRLDKRERIKGSLIGGAIGDALGYPVEFLPLEIIHSHYGRVETLVLEDGAARFSDDTQMTLFTACGLLAAETRRVMTGEACSVPATIHRAYLDWYQAQHGGGEPDVAWLLNVKELCVRRAPGSTCLGALESGAMGTLEQPINNSKGCGGVMRVAPIGLYYSPERMPPDQVMLLGAQAAAITHGHPTGYISAAALAYIVNQLVYNESAPLAQIIRECCDRLETRFGEDAKETCALLTLASVYSRGDMDEAKAIAMLGEGWTGDEALAIAAYCCLKHPHSFADAVSAAVNQSGDSDSTGAIAGNLIGAALGYGAIPKELVEPMELLWLLDEVAEDIAKGAQKPPEEGWLQKYALKKA